MLKIFRKFSMRSTPRIMVDLVFGKYLFVTNTISSGVLMFFGDLIDQELHHKKKGHKTRRFDYKRLGQMFIVGLTMGPVHHYYYGYINKLWPRRDMKSISKKILADQFIASPVFIVQFFYMLNLLEKRSFQESNEELKDKFLSIYMLDWCVWPPTQFINFYLVPTRYQVFYINGITMLYDVILSYFKHEFHSPNPTEGKNNPRNTNTVLFCK